MMLLTSADTFVEALRRHQLLDAPQVQELLRLSRGEICDAHSLAQHALCRNWLTPYQVNQLLQGRGAGLQVGPYALLERLGQGGMAQVFKARHRSLDRIVALKVIRPDYLKHPDAVGRFRREVQAVAQLSHPNIVLALDADEVGGTHFLVMEYVEGITLQRLVNQQGPLPVGQTCDFIRQAALGLQHAHERGLVHRDIKPSNLMVTPAHGSQSVGLSLVKLLDLGLARFRLTEAEKDSSELTRQGALIGTPEFLAPEQATNPHAADIRADLYSLGCTFYYLLTAQVPFPGGSTLEKLFQHRFDDPAPVEKLRPEVPSAVAAVVRKLMAKVPTQRYQEPHEVVAALLACNGCHDTAGEPANTSARRTWRFPLWFEKRSGTFARSTLRAVPAKVPDLFSNQALARETLQGSTTPLEQVPAAARKPRTVYFRPAQLILGGILLVGCLGLFLFLLLDTVRAPETAKPVQGPPTIEELARATLRKLIATAADPKSDLSAVRQEFVALRSQHYPGTAAARRAVELLSQFPSPLDQLDPRAVPAEDRLFGHPGGELILLLGDARLRHGAPVLAVAFGSDGRTVLSGSEDRQVYLWDVETGKRRAAFAGHTQAVTALACSPDGKMVGSASHDGTARLWEMASAKERAILRHPGGVRALAFSSDNKLVVTGSHGGHGQPGGAVRVWDAVEGKELFALNGHQGGVLAVAFSPNGQWIASGGEDKTVRLWDVSQRKEVSLFRGHNGQVGSVAFSADSNRLASASHDKTLRLWDVAQRKEASPPKDFGHGISGVSFLNGDTLVVACHDGTIRIWDRSKGQEKGVLRGHHGGVNGVALAARGELLVSAGNDATVRVWDLGKQEQIKLRNGLLGVLTALALSPDDKVIATGHTGGRIRLWEAATGKEQGRLDRHQHGVASLTFTPDGKALLSGGNDSRAILWNLANGKDRLSLEGHRATISGVAVSPDGQLVATCSHDGSARLWDARKGLEQRVWTGHGQGLCAVGFASDGKTVMTGSYDRSLKLWDTMNGSEKASVGEFTGDALAVAPDGKVLASGGAQGSVFLWNLAEVKSGNGKPVPGLNFGWLKAAAFSADGKILALAANDGRLLLWNVLQNKEHRQWQLPSVVQGLAFAGDGRHLACLLSNGTVAVFRLSSPPPEKSRPQFAL